MNDSQFDDFFNDRLRDHAAPVPKGLWEKVSEGQFDQTIGRKLRDAEAPVPDGLWEKVADAQFDNFIGDKLFGTEAAIPTGLWDKITDGQFDSFVAGKLIDHEAPVPAGLWEKVRPEEDDDRKGFIWFRYPAAAALIIAVLLAGGSYLYFTAKKDIVTPATENNASGTPKSNDSKTAVPDAPKATDQLSTVPPVTNPVTSDNKTAASDNGHLPSINHQLSTTPSAKNQKGKFDLRPVPPNNDITANSADIFNNHNKSVITADKVEDRLTAETEEYMQPYQTNHLAAFTIPSGMGTYSDKQQLQLSTLNHTNKYKSVIICPTDRGNNDWFLEVYASPDIALKSVSNISASQQYMDRKDSSESMQVGFSGGFRLVKPINDNILIKAGLQYSQINEKYVYRTENEVKTTTVVTVRTIIRAPGDTVIVHDTSTLQTVGFRNNTVNNHYRSFDIPLTVGYQFGDDDLKFGINAGVVFNISSWYQGVMLDSSLGTVPMNKSGSPLYRSNIGMGLIGSFSIVKRLSDDLHIFVDPYFRYNLSNMTSSQSPFNQKFNLAGVTFGLRFNLNRK
jgi:hypothetical protein